MHVQEQTFSDMGKKIKLNINSSVQSSVPYMIMSELNKMLILKRPYLTYYSFTFLKYETKPEGSGLLRCDTVSLRWCCLMFQHSFFLYLSNLEDEGSTFIQNIRKHKSSDTTSYSRTTTPSAQTWNPHI
jgi:hypothetical protein